MPAEPQHPPYGVAPHVPRQPRIPPRLWPVVAADARLLGLRQAAKQYGVSHETVRQIVRRDAGYADAPDHVSVSASAANA